MENNEIEYERTFLAKYVPSGFVEREIEIIDAYFPEDMSIHPKLRIRKSGDKYEITKKTLVREGDPSTQIEQNIELSESEFKALTSSACRSVEKRRLFISIDGADAQVDVFYGKLSGLVLIDFEFPSEQAMSSFVPPGCCLAEVTTEDFIAGGMLAGNDIESIGDQLSSFGYEMLG